MGRPDPELKGAVIAYLRRHHPDICRHWFDDIEMLEIGGGRLRLVVQEPIQLNFLRNRCRDPFREAVQHVTGHLVSVEFVGERDAAADSEATGASGGASSSRKANGSETKAGIIDLDPIYEQMILSPDYTFRNFVVGPGNQLAHAAAMAVAGKPGREYNPFFIHSGVGLGKTHLLQAISQQMMRNNPDVRIYYTSCNGFMNQFMDAVQAGELANFRHRFRNVDMLVIDDIHDLAQRDRTQEEFFHTFNTLYQAGKQIVLSSDAAPNRIPDLEERLVSRFSSGLVAHIERPCYETRCAIVKSKAGLRGVTIPDDVISYIANKVDTNIRELEGAITRVQGLSMVNDQPINLDLARKAIGDAFGSGQRRPSQPTIQDIMETVTSYYDVKLSDLLSKKRQKSIAVPRQICMWLARRLTRFSLEEIGGYFGGRDHTTVMHAVRTIEKRQKADANLEHNLAEIEQLVSNRESTAGEM